MDRIQKVLNKLSKIERDKVKIILSHLTNNEFLGSDIKKLKGHKDIFRVRNGDLRIIYRIKQGEFFILAIERRSEKTYRAF